MRSNPWRSDKYPSKIYHRIRLQIVSRSGMSILSKRKPKYRRLRISSPGEGCGLIMEVNAHHHETITRMLKIYGVPSWRNNRGVLRCFVSGSTDIIRCSDCKLLDGHKLFGSVYNPPPRTKGNRILP